MDYRKTYRAVLIWGVLCSVAAAQDAGSLSFRLLPGRKTYYESTWERTADVETHHAGAQREQTMGMRTVMTYSVKELAIVGPELGSLEFTLLGLRKSVTGGSVTVAYDSRDPDRTGSPLGQALTALLDKPIRLIVNRGGHIVAFVGLDELLQEAAEQAPANLGEVASLERLSHLGDVFLDPLPVRGCLFRELFQFRI